MRERLIYCSKCGQHNPDDSRFCTRCASPLAPQPIQPQPPAPPPTYASYAPPAKKDNRTLIIVVVVLVAIIVVAGGYIAWLVFQEVDDLSDSEVTITVRSFVGVTLELELEIEGELVDSFTLAPGDVYVRTFPFDPFAGGPNAFEVQVIRYEGNAIYSTYEGTIAMDQDQSFYADISIYA